MKTGRKLVGATLALAMGCGSPGDDARSTVELERYCAVARQADLESWVGDVVTRCETRDEEVTCSVSRAQSALEPITLAGAPDLRRALPAGDGRMLLSLADGRLLLTAADGTVERELAAWASDPWVSDDGARAAWIGLAEGLSEWEPGAPTVVVAQDLADGAPSVLAEDELASAPRPIPGSRDVLFVSARTGLASYWVAGPGHEPRQLTNLGLTEPGQPSVPVAERELTWSGSALFYAVDDRVLRLTLDGESREVGPGRWPRARADGSVLALVGGGSACAAIYPAGGAP